MTTLRLVRCGGCPARRLLLRSPSLDFAQRASLRLFQFSPGELVLLGQEKVTKEKAARRLAAARFPRFSSFQAIRATREAKSRLAQTCTHFP